MSIKVSLRSARQAHGIFTAAAYSARSYSSPTSPPARGPDVAEQLRQVMRTVPQPVAIAVTRLPETEASSPDAFHGATLSSFTSLTLHPHPLIAFSLRLPSRLAESLRSPKPSPFSSKAVSPNPSTPAIPFDPLAPASSPDSITTGKTLSISLLSTTHESIAKELSRPGQDHTSIFSASPFRPASIANGASPGSAAIGETEGLPILPDAIGNMTCEVLSSTLLKDVYPNQPVDEEKVDFDDEVEGGGLYKPTTPQSGVETTKAEAMGDRYGSELFICRVLDVEGGSGANSPLLYLNQKYTTVA